MKIFKNKKILITGGTGSFGNAFVSRLLKTKCNEIRIFSRDEKKQFDMRNFYKNERLNFMIGNIQDYNSVLDATNKIDFVFHAAALKQVPSCEFYPLEAIKTNVIGAENIIRASVNSKVKKCVLLSTDKAVYPINSMGLTKALMEKIMVSRKLNDLNKGTIICATRYGNVMGSRGSVIPLFIEQMKNNKEITITNPDMTRFLMSLDDSINLVIKAFNSGKNGDIFVQKSPASTIINLLNALKDIMNKKVKINYIGIRHGEKMHETLVSKEEMIRANSQAKYYVIKSDNRDQNYDNYFFKGKNKVKYIEYSSKNTKQLNKNQVKKILKKIFFSNANINSFGN